MSLHHERFDADDLVPCVDATPVEHFGGPNDGEFLPINQNGNRPNGLYVPMNTLLAEEPEAWACVGMMYVPR